MDLSSENIAVRIWSGGYSIDKVSTPQGEEFKLINLPFYYIAALPRILDKEVNG